MIEARVNGAKRAGIIHLVDDEADIVATANSALRSHGFEVHAFSSADKALEDIERACRDNMSMLITDLRMPSHSGFEIARRARTIIPDLPVVLMTAFEVNLVEFEKLFPSLRVDEILQKPFHINQLVSVAKKYSRNNL
jgi:FixJ family two-component response regulator